MRDDGGGLALTAASALLADIAAAVAAAGLLPREHSCSLVALVVVVAMEQDRRLFVSSAPAERTKKTNLKNQVEVEIPFCSDVWSSVPNPESSS